MVNPGVRAPIVPVKPAVVPPPVAFVPPPVAVVRPPVAVVRPPVAVVRPPTLPTPQPSVAKPAAISPQMAKAPGALPPMPPRISPPSVVMAPRPPPLPNSAPISPAGLAAPAGVSSAHVTIQGDVKTLHLKPPIVVRDFAIALGLKPFKLISELNQLVGFAAMNSNIDEVVAQKVAEKYGFALEIKHRGDLAVR